MRVRIYIRIQAGASIHFGHSSIIIWSTVRESKDTHQHPKSSRFRVVNPELSYAGPSVSPGEEAAWQPSAAMLTFLFFLHFSAQPPQWVLHLSYLNLSTIFTFSLSPTKLFFSCHIYQPDYFSSNLLPLVFGTVPPSILIMPISSPILLQVHCSGHASSLPTWHGTELLPACGPHDYNGLGAGLCRVLPSPLRLQHYR